MSVRIRNMRWFGLMALLTVLLSVSIVSCANRSGPVIEPSATVQGMAWNDMDGDGIKDPAETVLSGASMTLIGSTSYGPKNRASDGTYSFTATPASYTLRCSATGFVTQNRSISLANGETEIQDFGMKH